MRRWRPPLPPGTNPRDVFGKHRERGPKKYTYTNADVALLVGCTLHAVKKASSRGQVDLTDLGSVVRWSAARLGWAPPGGSP